ncbi:CcdC family protein [Paenibacillus ehimensis]|uniref:Cytochrome c biogenesis protein CcdC n=1 Tax=Paenibacillus ehimensis TaxID=79264 RepID=A0ABT8VA60_9BACL|nr:cytochrome c biogenesis protein CcdC [Paenibacillus ehimensis]MDO3677851.1 cytochrome c biogenesis protein CcdC [Paenibacillus ehimensis]MEC0209323.1 cytochrome c biogenesis protein CcdC [Paenibacillus ehimensis]
MIHFGALHLQAVSGIGMAAMALLAIFVRARASRKPLSPAKIVMPPVGMSTGFLMFAVPAFRLPALWALLALAAGLLLFSYPLIRGTKLELRGGEVYVNRSKSFMFVLLGLLVLRLALHSYIELYISIPQTGALFFLLAFGMIVPWRAAMLLQYRSLRRTAA